MKFTAPTVFASLLPLCLLAPAMAQGPVCTSVSPNPVPAGTSSITINVTDSTGMGFEHWTACVARTLRQDVPGGFSAPIPLGLCGPWTPVGAYGTASKTFPFTASLAPGLYYAEVVTRPVSGIITETTWVPVTIVGASSPTLVEQNTLQVGQVWSVDLSAPNMPNTLYIGAAAFSTNTGFTLPSGEFASLDSNDPLFNLTYPVALPIFQNLSGLTDASGNFSSITVAVPNDPSIAYLPIYLQCGLVPFTGGIPLTNVISACVAP